MSILNADTTSFLNAFLEHLLHRSDSVTFYEAIEVLDVARTIDKLEDETLRRMLLLHDAAHATDGARSTLAPFIKMQANKRAQALALAQRPLLLTDDRKTARARAGAVLHLHLAERRASGFLWRVVQADGPVAITRQGDRADAPSTAFFEATLLGPGSVDMSLTESFVGRRAPHNNREKTFTLRVYVDPAASDLVT